MTEEQKQQYVKRMNEKAVAFATDALSDIKSYMPKDEYEEALRDFTKVFLCGADAAVKTMNEIVKGEQL